MPELQNSTNTYKTIGILGGLGPQATIDIFNRIIELTPKYIDIKGDHSHLPIIVFNIPQIPSRVKAILHDGPSPLPLLTEYAKKLEKAGADFIIIPCNTASYYISDIRKSVQIPVLDIVEETVKYIHTKYPKFKNLGLLATEAGIRTAVYQKQIIKEYSDEDDKVVENVVERIKKKYFRTIDVFNDNSINLSNGDSKENTQVTINLLDLHTFRKKVVRAISGKMGIKSGYYIRPAKLLHNAVHILDKQGADCVIMGCTEIPLALKQENVNTRLINPNEILAISAIKLAKE